MALRLSSVLSPHDLPEAELHAAKLDGEVFAVGTCFSPVDEAIGPEHRAQSLSATLPAKMIADQHTAAWIYGVLDSPPNKPNLSIDPGSQSRHIPGEVTSVREVAIEATEFRWIGGMRVTTPIRTALDVARNSINFGPTEMIIVKRLSELGRFDYDDCVVEINQRRNLPHKRRALERVRTALDSR